MVLGLPPLVVYISAAIAACTIGFTRPTQGALLPELSRTPEELSVANGVSGHGRRGRTVHRPAGRRGDPDGRAAGGRVRRRRDRLRRRGVRWWCRCRRPCHPHAVEADASSDPTAGAVSPRRAARHPRWHPCPAPERRRPARGHAPGPSWHGHRGARRPVHPARPRGLRDGPARRRDPERRARRRDDARWRGGLQPRRTASIGACPGVRRVRVRLSPSSRQRRSGPGARRRSSSSSPGSGSAAADVAGRTILPADDARRRPRSRPRQSRGVLPVRRVSVGSLVVPDRRGADRDRRRPGTHRRVVAGRGRRWAGAACGGIDRRTRVPQRELAVMRAQSGLLAARPPPSRRSPGRRAGGPLDPGHVDPSGRARRCLLRHRARPVPRSTSTGAGAHPRRAG